MQLVGATRTFVGGWSFNVGRALTDMSSSLFGAPAAPAAPAADADTASMSAQQKPDGALAAAATAAAAPSTAALAAAALAAAEPSVLHHALTTRLRMDRPSPGRTVAVPNPRVEAAVAALVAAVPAAAAATTAPVPFSAAELAQQGSKLKKAGKKGTFANAPVPVVRPFSATTDVHDVKVPAAMPVPVVKDAKTAAKKKNHPVTVADIAGAHLKTVKTAASSSSAPSAAVSKGGKKRSHDVDNSPKVAPPSKKYAKAGGGH